ncbi:hypothetical protein [Streptomyces sp. NPDC058382]|uniref:hypothetical protein n=1 Tax=unclassified Streptomyces TaxID=2593676 RepID=UPI003638474F
MTGRPGAPRVDAYPGERPDAPAHRRHPAGARQFLAALLLAVLAVAGGAPAAAGAGLPTRSTAAATSVAGDPAGARPPGRDLGRSHRANARSAPGAHHVPRTRATAEDPRPGPVTAPEPWAAAEHPRSPQHLPPPGPGAPLPRPPGILPPHPVPGCAPAAPTAAADRFRAALPGVRGPPHTAVHLPWDPSPLRSPVPSRTPAAAP